MNDTDPKQGKLLTFRRLPEGDALRKTHLSLEVEGDGTRHVIDVSALVSLLKGTHSCFVSLTDDYEGGDHAE